MTVRCRFDMLRAALGAGARMKYAQLKRGEFLTRLSGVFAAWPVVARAQHTQGA